MDGRLMLTIEASSIVMNVPIATKENVVHGFGDSCRTTASLTATKLGRAGRCPATEASTDSACPFIKWLLAVPSRYPPGVLGHPDKPCSRSGYANSASHSRPRAG